MVIYKAEFFCYLNKILSDRLKQSQLRQHLKQNTTFMAHPVLIPQ